VFAWSRYKYQCQQHQQRLFVTSLDLVCRLGYHPFSGALDASENAVHPAVDFFFLDDKAAQLLRCASMSSRQDCG
jgi:hypothetical protein